MATGSENYQLIRLRGSVDRDCHSQPTSLIRGRRPFIDSCDAYSLLLEHLKKIAWRTGGAGRAWSTGQPVAGLRNPLFMWLVARNQGG